jgi:hypothetical protein
LDDLRILGPTCSRFASQSGYFSAYRDVYYSISKWLVFLKQYQRQEHECVERARNALLSFRTAAHRPPFCADDRISATAAGWILESYNAAGFAILRHAGGCWAVVHDCKPPTNDDYELDFAIEGVLRNAPSNGSLLDYDRERMGEDWVGFYERLRQHVCFLPLVRELLASNLRTDLAAVLKDGLALAREEMEWEFAGALSQKEVKPRHEAFVGAPLQMAIYAALKKQPLADAVCSGEGTRLYKPNGIKEMKAAGVVKHKPGVGYYRSDAPPPNLTVRTAGPRRN